MAPERYQWGLEARALLCVAVQSNANEASHWTVPLGERRSWDVKAPPSRGSASHVRAKPTHPAPAPQTGPQSGRGRSLCGSEWVSLARCARAQRLLSQCGRRRRGLSPAAPGQAPPQASSI
ncbi:hypothetical protein AAFF_G00248390 [Aldrovandia affinis]|uniref:Uncharacterized protein n=1 Tax=Aldrovandia affinis TaxID=143900 RepID=A0AAD7W3D2_9TELE|nr:hypothetical protein AAFF_G00248390 [Aldrovandia affinis]